MKKALALLLLLCVNYKIFSQCSPPTKLNPPQARATIAVLSWDAVPNATSYKISYKVPGAAAWIDSNTTATNIQLNGLTDTTTYVWKVAVTCTAGNAESGEDRFTTLKSATPAAGTPAAGNAGSGAAAAGAGTTTTTEQATPKPAASSSVSPDISLNFAGKNTSWGNITPVISYAYNREVLGEKGYLARWTKNGKKKKISMNWWFQIGPYLGAQFPIKDSASYLPALMLPGSGLQLNNFFTLPAKNANKFSVTVSPLNFGVKAISGFTDSTVTLVQHSIRSSVLFNLNNEAQLSIQYTHGWHNLTTESEQRFKDIFKTNYTDVAYLNVTISAKLANLSAGQTNSPLFFVFRWQNMLGDRLKELPNKRILSFGLLANIDFRAGTHQGLLPMAPR